MNNNINEINELEVIKNMKRDLKPKLFWPIWNTVICSGPPLNLIFRYFLIRDIKNPTTAIILTVIAMLWTILNWYWYAKERNNFEKHWVEISLELQASGFEELYSLDSEEKSSKNRFEKISNVLSIAAIASLVMFFVFVVILILSNLTFIKYFMLLSLLIFLIAIIILAIHSIFQIFSFYVVIIKERGLLKVLSRFVVLYSLSFITLAIINFIIHKNPEWIKTLLNSIWITFSIFIFTEVFLLYKEVKKAYSLNTSPKDGNNKDD